MNVWLMGFTILCDAARTAAEIPTLFPRRDGNPEAARGPLALNVMRLIAEKGRA